MEYLADAYRLAPGGEKGLQAVDASTSPEVTRIQRDGAWQAHPVLSALLRCIIFAVPIAAALVATWVARSVLPVPSSTGGWVLWWAALLVIGLSVSLGTERIARRLLPLAMLLKLAMLFPDQAPSRFRVARHAGSVGQLRSDLDEDQPDEEVSDRAGKILGLVTALAAHDRKTRGHAERVRVFTDLLTKQMKLPEEDRYRLRWAALLHDIGKLTVEPDTLNKPGALDAAEWESIRGHPHEGARLAGPLLGWLAPWGDAIAQHHERFDGGGYPAGLAGQGISEAARIVAVADSYDTMTSARTYQKPRSTAAARRELVACAGGQFDPVIVRAFLEISLPRLLWAVGPVSLLVHLPFLARLQEIGQASMASAAQTATVTALAGATAVGLLGVPAAGVAAAAPHARAGSPATTSQTFTTVDVHPIHPSALIPTGGSGHPGAHPSHDQGSGSPGTSGAGTSSGGTTPGTGSGATTGTGSGTGTGTGTGSSGGSNTGSGGTSGGGSGTTVSIATTLDLIAALRAAIVNSGIDPKRIEDLTQHLDDASQRLVAGNLENACARLDNFVARVDEQENKPHPPIDAATAQDWITRAQAIGTSLAC